MKFPEPYRFSTFSFLVTLEEKMRRWQNLNVQNKLFAEYSDRTQKRHRGTQVENNEKLKVYSKEPMEWIMVRPRGQ